MWQDRSLKAITRATRKTRWRLFRRSLAKRSAAIQELARRAATDAGAAQVLCELWGKLSKERNNQLLVLLAQQIGQYKILNAIPSAREIFSLHGPADGHAVRESAVDALAAIGSDAANMVTPGIADPDPAVAAWTVVALRRIGLRSSASRIAEWFDEANPEAQRQMILRLAEVRNQSWEDMIALLAGCVSGGPVAYALAQRVLGSLDLNRLERECIRFWTLQRSAAARSVLTRVFEYDLAAFS